jgi:tRNA-uridine 2-sulfurtransferase
VKTFSGSASDCGDLAWIELDVESGRVLRARGEGPGVPELIGTVAGLSLLEAAAVPASRLAGDALHEALAQAATAFRDPARIAVAMSGGVDSAVALLRVREAGHEPVGVTLRLWIDPRGPDTERACCSPASVVAAREGCHRLGIPHFTLDLREGFRRAVVAPFVRGYARGETPNPCVRCNASFRFVELLSFARRIGAARLATGHYARIVERDGRPLVARGVDSAKDQSYMLGALDPGLLDRLWFPLGSQTKADTRRQAGEAGLEAAGRPESQEACFLAGADYRDFLAGRIDGAAEGPIVDEEGRELGRHAGIWRYTPGQRRGIGVATPMALYTLRTDARTNTVVVGPRQSLARTRVTSRAGRLYLPVERAEAKLRYRSPATPARVEAGERGFRLELDEPVYGVAPGQAAVLYDADVVVGAGVISD